MLLLRPDFGGVLDKSGPIGMGRTTDTAANQDASQKLCVLPEVDQGLDGRVLRRQKGFRPPVSDGQARREDLAGMGSVLWAKAHHGFTVID